jgi:hypothetical protein
LAGSVRGHSFEGISGGSSLTAMEVCAVSLNGTSTDMSGFGFLALQH